MSFIYPCREIPLCIDLSLIIKEQWAAVKRPGSNSGFNYGESGDRTIYLVVTGRPLSPTELQLTPKCRIHMY